MAMHIAADTLTPSPKIYLYLSGTNHSITISKPFFFSFVSGKSKPSHFSFQPYIQLLYTKQPYRSKTACKKNTLKNNIYKRHTAWKMHIKIICKLVFCIKNLSKPNYGKINKSQFIWKRWLVKKEAFTPLLHPI